MGQCTSGDILANSNEASENKTVDNGHSNHGVQCGELKNSSSLPMFRRRNSISSWVGEKLRGKEKRNDLSAAFSLLDTEQSNLIDINTATEEELMTLSGINRQLSHNIVQYRTAIGGFRRVEDLALVSGIGALKLQELIHDVSITKVNSFFDSLSSSIDSLPSCSSAKSRKSGFSSQKCDENASLLPINVNTASIFDLMVVKGITQEMAANIVHFRDKRGRFKNVDDLSKVRGLNHKIVCVLKIYLTCSDSKCVPIDSVSVQSSERYPALPIVKRLKCHRRTHSAPMNNSESGAFSLPAETISNKDRFSSEFSEDLFELLSIRSERPKLSKPFNGQFNGLPAIRIGSWNMQRLSLDKVNNPGVLEVICTTILESGFSILAMQEVMSADVLIKICAELNCGTLRRVREWKGPKAQWKWTCSQEFVEKSRGRVKHLAFVYNTSHSIKLSRISTLRMNSNNNINVYESKPLVALFNVRDIQMTFINLHVKSTKGRRSIIEEVSESEESTIEHCSPKSFLKIEKATANGIDNKLPNSIHNGVNSADADNNESRFAPLITAINKESSLREYIVILGNFNFPPNDAMFSIFEEFSFSNLIPADVPTDIGYDNPKGKCCNDNILVSSNLSRFNTQSFGVVRDGLSHMAIPRGWGWGGMVSSHCPIYVDLLSSSPQAHSLKEEGKNGDL